jgi:dienelactone hydrolase
MLHHRRAYPALDAALPARWDHLWYALAVVESDTAQDAELRITGHDGCRVWWNGRFVHEEHSWHKMPFDLHTVPVRLRRGPNTLLVKLDRFGVVARLTAPGGRRLKGKARSLTPALARPQPPGTMEQLARYSGTLKVTMPCRARTKAEYLKWKRAARAHYRRCLGSVPTPPKPRPELVRTENLDGCQRRLYHLNREAGSTLPVWVLVPDGDRFNGRTVICPHGHGQDDLVVAGAKPPARPYGNWFGPYSGNYAELLARRGFLTATWAERALSHRRKDDPREGNRDPCNLASIAAEAMGMTLPGLHLYDLRGVTEFVLNLTGADPSRVGVTGLSGGGTMTVQAGAYDETFKAMAVFCGCHSYADYARGRDGCGQQIVPGLYPTLDTPELICLMAPRPVLLGQGRRDVTFNTFLLARFARQARRAYRALGAASRVKLHLYDLAHQVDIDAAETFFLKNL